MSQADIQRFVSDLKDNQGLLNEVKSGAVGLAAVVELAQSKGYDITVDEAKAYIRGQANKELSDEQLDAVAGGKGHHHSMGVKVAVAAVEAAMAVTSAVQTAEAVTTVAEAADVATTAEAVAEVGIAIVLT